MSIKYGRDLLRHGQRVIVGIGMKAILVGLGKLHHGPVVKVGVEEEHWHLQILLTLKKIQTLWIKQCQSYKWDE